MKKSPWISRVAPEKSFRSIFRWGDPKTFKHPNYQLYSLLKENFKLDDRHFQKPLFTGEERVDLKLDIKLPESFIRELEATLGEEKIQKDPYNRILYSTGKTTEEALALRHHMIKDITDIVVHPHNSLDVQAVVLLCNKYEIPLSVYGGGSSVTLGHSMKKGGVSLVMSTHMNRVLSFNEADSSISVEAGILGPDYERALNEAPERFGALHRYTCGHFPQSFEFSTVGGWILTLGSGQASSYYGDAADLLLSLELISPEGKFITRNIAAMAAGPRIQDIFKGSEGTFGVLTSLSLKIFRKMPGSTKSFSFIFPDWNKAVAASREISQGRFGMPAVFRISDAEETDIAMKLYGIDKTPIDGLISLAGYKPQKRCLALGTAEGESGFSKNVKKNIKAIARRYGALSLGSYPVRKWKKGRYLDPYMREDLLDFGIIIDTLETSVNWSSLHRIHKSVRAFIKARPQTICMTHASHFYPQGTNLYFIFITRAEDLEEYRAFQREIIKRILSAGGSLSHHHGIGKMMGPFMEEELGKESMDLLKAIKKHLDPKGIMSPGQLGL